MKKFWKYFLILILLLSGLFCVGLLYLFFVPNSSMFAITYITYSNKYQTKAYNKADIQSIELNSMNYDIVVSTSSSDNVYALVHAKSFGYVLKENSEINIKYEVISGTLKINISEPHGFAFKNGSKIELMLPKEFSPNLKITNNKANTTISSKDISINNLTYETKSGDFNFSTGSIAGEMNLKLNKAKFSLGSTVATSTTNATIQLTSGQFNAGTHSFNTINVLENTNGLINVKSCTAFNSQAKSAGGKYIIGSADNANITSSDTNIEIGSLKGGSIDLTESGKIYIKKIEGIVTLKTNSGSIAIDEATTSFATSSESGDQTIKNATYQVNCTSTYGNIKISFKSDAGDFNTDETYPYRSVIAATKNGKITVSGVDNINLIIKDNGTGRADINMRRVLGNNIVDAQRGSVNITIPQTEIYNLITESTAGGSVYVNVGQFAVNGYTDQTRQENLISSTAGVENSDNYLIVTTTSGSLKIQDTLLA